MAAHFVAVVKIEKVIPAGENIVTGRGPATQSARRQKGELVHLTIRADSVDSLVSKVKTHLGFVDDTGVEMTD